VPVPLLDLVARAIGVSHASPRRIHTQCTVTEWRASLQQRAAEPNRRKNMRATNARRDAPVSATHAGHQHGGMRASEGTRPQLYIRIEFESVPTRAKFVVEQPYRLANTLERQSA
jgi:hypothetical protein